MEHSEQAIRSAIETCRESLRQRMLALQESQQRLQTTVSATGGLGFADGAGLPHSVSRSRARGNPKDEARIHHVVENEIARHDGRDQLLRRLITVQDEERRRIARELHDEMGQSLTAMLMGLKHLEDSCRDNSAVCQQLLQLQQLTDAMSRELHDLAVRLRPASLADCTLRDALIQYISNWSSRSGIKADFHCGDEVPQQMPPEIESAIYRFVQESLNNVVKHAQAKRVSIVLMEWGGLLTVIVEDNGVGFDCHACGHGRHGLVGMRERLAAIGGHLELESSPGQGTSLFARIPSYSDMEVK